MVFSSSKSSSTPIIAAPILYLLANALSNFISGVTIFVTRCNLSLAVSISENGTTLNNIAAMSVLAYATSGVMERVSITVQNQSSLSLSVVAADPRLHSYYQNIDPAIFFIRCVGPSMSSIVVLRDLLLVTSGGANFRIVSVVTRNSIDTTSILSVKYFVILSAISIALLDGTSTFVSSNCGGTLCGEVLQRWPSAHIVEFLGVSIGDKVVATNMTNITLRASGMTMHFDFPKACLAFTWEEALVLQALNVTVLSSVMQTTAAAFDIGSATKGQSLIDVSGNDNATGVTIAVTWCTFYFVMNSGGALITLTSVIGLLDNVSHSSVYVANVAVTSSIVNGTLITLVTFSPITIGPSIVNLLMQTPAYVNKGAGLSMTIINSSMEVEHATTVPASATLIGVISIAAAVNIVRSMRDLVIDVQNVHIHRVFPTTSPSLSFLSKSSVLPGAAINVTAIVNLFDAMSTIALFNPSLSFAIQIVYSLSGGTPAPVNHKNSVTTLRKK